MKADEIRVGRHYLVTLKGDRVVVKITGRGSPGGWDGRNLETDRRVHIHDAKQFILDQDAAEEAAEAVERALRLARLGTPKR